MRKTGNRTLTLLAILTLGVTARGQDAISRDPSRTAGPAVTISVVENGIRFAALGSFGKMRLEVFNADGTSLYNSDFRPASVRDWALDDKDGQRLPDGTYLCVITIRDLSGRMSTRQGTVIVQGGQPLLKLPDGESVEVAEPDKSLARVTDPANANLTLIGHDGENGQVVNTRGALTFRFGDFFSAKDRERMRLTEEGNLGIGTSTPEFKLDVAGAIRARDGFIFNNGSTLNVNDNGALTLTNSNGKGGVTLTNSIGTVTPSAAGTGTQNYIAKWAETGGAGTLQNSGIFETAGGNVGIATANPGASLDVAKYTRILGAATGVGIPTSGKGMELNYDTSTNVATINSFNRDSFTYQPFYLNGFVLSLNGSSGGNVGIGTTSPGASLDVAKYTRILGAATAVGIPTSGKGMELNYDTSTNVGTINSFSRDSGLYQPLYLNGSVLSLNGSSAGNVGIGTNNPQSLLDVNGNFNVTGNATVSGNIAAKYQDIAEWTSARTKLPAGTVVSLDMLNPNSVLASTKPYDTRVAGVVSAQPGVILGEGGPNRVLIATTGRVKVRVSANRCPIHIGDLLVASDKPGVAMKSLPLRIGGRIMHRPGTIIGKALEPLARGEGEILVLLSLQ